MRMSNKIARNVLWLGNTKKKKKTEGTEKSVKSEQSENAARLVVVSVAFEKKQKLFGQAASPTSTNYCMILINKLMHVAHTF